MTQQRIFLGWSQPLLASVVEHLDRTVPASGRIWDLRRRLIVLPTSRAVRRLKERLVVKAADAGTTLLLPEILTSGEIPERVCAPGAPLATPLESRLAWRDAISALDAGARRVLFGAEGAPRERLLHARRCQGVWEEIAGTGRTFDEIRAAVEQCAVASETEQWQVFEELLERYRGILGEHERADRHVARIEAIESGTFAVTEPVLVAGCVDLSEVQCRILAAIPAPVTYLVFAPETRAQDFDEQGRLVHERWLTAPVPLPDSSIRVIESVWEQPVAIRNELARFSSEWRGDQISIGLGDEERAPWLGGELELLGIPAHDSRGTPLADHPAVAWVRPMVGYLGSATYDGFARLLREPAVSAWLARVYPERFGERGALVARSDLFQWEHLQRGVTLPPGAREDAGVVADLRDALNRLFEPLSGFEGELREGLHALLRVLREVLSAEALAQTPEHVGASAAFMRVMEDLHEAANLIGGGESFNGRDLAGFVLDLAAEQRIPAPSGWQRIEMLGWLELLTDDAPAVIVADCNEGLIPQSTPIDPLLPDMLRNLLALPDAGRRFARDRYVVSALLSSCRRLVMCVPLADERGESRMPSRLLYAVPRSELAGRVRALAEPAAVATVSRCVGSTARTELLTLPDFERYPVPESMSVTSLGTYLMCPFTYFLRHIARVESRTDEAVELDASRVGVVTHAVLARMGRSVELRHETNPAVIGEFLEEALRHEVRRRFGAAPLPAVLVQTESTARRLRVFARQQAERRAAGWVIEHVELEVPEAHGMLDVDGASRRLTGTVDRIDRNERTGAFAVIDYKQSKQSPKRGGEWSSVQLPVYAHLLRAMVGQTPELSYWTLPVRSQRSGYEAMRWEDEERASAVEAARGAVRGILERRFWPPGPGGGFGSVGALVESFRSLGGRAAA